MVELHDVQLATRFGSDDLSRNGSSDAADARFDAELFEYLRATGRVRRTAITRCGSRCTCKGRRAGGQQPGTKHDQCNDATHMRARDSAICPLEVNL